MSADFVGQVRLALAQVADPGKAPAMQAYMKSQMPFLGVQKQQRTAALRPVLRDAPADRTEWLAAASHLWDEAQYREERYAALAVLRLHPDWLTPDDEAYVRGLITTGAWWDLVDEIATKLVTPRFALREWARDDDMWIRRASIISQVGAKDTTDTDVLVDVIEPNTKDRRFWITKAIGWALRDYARTNPDWVRAFVADHELAPLSMREATKHLDRA